ncbi:MAG: GDP-mannose 4,6-dehydratase, partial [Candidatus Tectomicrobia bacterium]
MAIVVTGGCGFIGSAVVRQMVNESDATVINIDKLTYAGTLGSVASVANDERYYFEHMDICDRQDLDSVFGRYQPHAI